MATKAQKKAPADKKTLTVVQTGSVTKIKQGMRDTLVGLGLGKPRASRVLEDSPAVRGMIRKVRHLVRIDGEGEIHG